MGGGNRGYCGNARSGINTYYQSNHPSLTSFFFPFFTLFVACIYFLTTSPHLHPFSSSSLLCFSQYTLQIHLACLPRHHADPGDMTSREDNVLKPRDPSLTDENDWEEFSLSEVRILLPGKSRYANLLAASSDNPVQVTGCLDEVEEEQESLGMHHHHQDGPPSTCTLIETSSTDDFLSSQSSTKTI